MLYQKTLFNRGNMPLFPKSCKVILCLFALPSAAGKMARGRLAELVPCSTLQRQSGTLPPARRSSPKGPVWTREPTIGPLHSGTGDVKVQRPGRNLGRLAKKCLKDAGILLRLLAENLAVIAALLVQLPNVGVLVQGAGHHVSGDVGDTGINKAVDAGVARLQQGPDEVYSTGDCRLDVFFSVGNATCRLDAFNLFVMLHRPGPPIIFEVNRSD